MTDTYDPWQSAEDAEAKRGPFRVFGQCMVDVWPCVLVKGSRPVQYDASQHNVDQRRTRIMLTIYPLASSPLKNPIERGLIAESKEWTEVVRPSLRAINTELRALHKAWVYAEMTPTREYTKTDGTTGQATVPTFLAVYPDEAACEAVAAATFQRHDDTANGATNGAANGATPSPAPAISREQAAKFLEPLWKASNQDITRFETLLKKTQHVKEYFDLTSPEVVTVMSTF